MELCKVLVAALAISTAQASPYKRAAKEKRQVEELRDEYDFVVVGGGTAGLTVADRLSEAFPERSVLVIEYGVVEKAKRSSDPPSVTGRGASSFSIASLPIKDLNNRRASLAVGKTVGGSSAINGQFFDRGSRFDFAEWEEFLSLSDEEENDERDRWDWEGIIPWYKKSVTFYEPSAEEAEEFGYTWDVEAAYGGKSGIHSSFPPFQWPAVGFAWDTLVELGLEARKECAGGDKDGICWVPTSQHPVTAERSHAGLGHYADIIDKRTNYDLLVGHKVTRLIVNDDGAPTVEFRAVGAPEGDDEDGIVVQTVTPKLEVVLSAGAIHTPHILQRSGIASAEFLESAGIEVVKDLPGVGYNFQDHCGPSASFSVPTPELHPSRGDLTSNSTFRQEALDQFEERPAKGPYTLAMGNTAIYVALPTITEDYPEIISAIRAQIEDGSAESYLPDGTPDAVKAGYATQLEVLAKSLENPRHPVMEAPFQGFPGSGFHLKPLSRGTVLLNPEDHDATPLVDYRTASNPIDMDIMANYITFYRRLYSLESLGAKEIRPGADVKEKEDIIEFMRGVITPSFMHPCCTAAMMPEEKGGVVGSDLRVYGIEGLRVVDASIFPTIPGTHTSATVYAVAEKAADIITRRWKGKEDEPKKKKGEEKEKKPKGEKEKKPKDKKKEKKPKDKKGDKKGDE